MIAIGHLLSFQLRGTRTNSNHISPQASYAALDLAGKASFGYVVYRHGGRAGLVYIVLSSAFSMGFLYVRLRAILERLTNEAACSPVYSILH